MSNKTILRNGRVVDPVSGRDGNDEIWVADSEIVPTDSFDEHDAKIINVPGCLVVPGLIDMHVHLREPGEEYKETIASGCRAAAAGGFVAVACMPNTNPVNDCGTVSGFIVERAVGCDARVYPVGAISVGSHGERLAEFGEMKQAGAVALSDDGRPVVSSQLMRRAMEYADSHRMLIISHSEEPTLSQSGCMNEGALSVSMGLKGIPAAAESIMVFREIALAELTGAKVHIAHVSCKESIALIRDAKQRGVRVTAESAPHYFTLCEDAVRGYATNAKMNPPLRRAEDMKSVRQALADGTLDAIATDHAPHSQLEKEVEFNRAANGIMGLETALPLTLALVRDGVFDEQRMVELMSSNPAAILGVPGGSLAVGSPADITVIDPDRRFLYSIADGKSLGRNSPFDGQELQGKAVLTMLNGRITHDEI